MEAAGYRILPAVLLLMVLLSSTIDYYLGESDATPDILVWEDEMDGPMGSSNSTVRKINDTKSDGSLSPPPPPSPTKEPTPNPTTGKPTPAPPTGKPTMPPSPGPPPPPSPRLIAPVDPKKGKRYVYVYQGDWPNQALLFMYKMLVQTVVDGFEGLGVTPVFMHVDYTIPNTTTAGDFVVWVGSDIKRSDLMIQFRQRGCYTILYQTELVNKPNYCTEPTWSKAIYNEIWDYGWGNVELLRRCPGTLPPARYVPAGYLKNWPKLPPYKEGNVEKIVFFGSLDYNRMQCWSRMLKAANLQPKLTSVYNIWKLEQFVDYIEKKEEGVNRIWVNIHKWCKYPHHGNNSDALEPRMSVLLSTKGLLISDRSFWKDEFSYRDILDFAEIDDMEKVFARIYQLSIADRQKLLDTRWERYKQRFNPAQLLKNANVHLLLEENPRVVLADVK